MPKRTIAETKDKAPTKQQLKNILNYLDIKGKALVLFLVSSGCKIGETLQLALKDIKLETDPPTAHIRGKTTKGGVGERTVYFSYEARDSIKAWLQIKDAVTKKNGEHYDIERVFGWENTR